MADDIQASIPLIMGILMAKNNFTSFHQIPSRSLQTCLVVKNDLQTAIGTGMSCSAAARRYSPNPHSRTSREEGTRNLPSLVCKLSRFRERVSMVSEGIMTNGCTELYVYQGDSVKIWRYVDEVLETPKLDSLVAVGLEFLLMDDNDRSHQAHVASEDISRIDLPFYSPDLNSIEHVWDALEHQISARQSRK
ncbi:transposable element Tc1 transposase [Trichonephila clavipes]|nr:transposable element Tc1 transposase [Trichonephila clavipes]